MTDMEIRFELILAENRHYTTLLKVNADAKTQMEQLDRCTNLFSDLILSKGLANEYAEYCNMKKAKGLA